MNTNALFRTGAALISLLTPVALAEDEFDWGDAPQDPVNLGYFYQTLSPGGAHHFIVPGVLMGVLIDGEGGGQPTIPADGDDLNNQPDEDGVSFGGPLMPGLGTPVTVTVSQPGWLDVWLDGNNNATFDAPVDLVYSAAVVPGVNNLMVTVPAGTMPGPNYMRFRYNTGGPLPPDGPAQDGEVEDYRVNIEEEQFEELDWGDAPEQMGGFNYQTTSANNGANHLIVQGVFMGTLIDGEGNGQPTIPADGDDLSNMADEDGVSFGGPLVAGQGATVTVTVSKNGWLDVWLDGNNNGTFDTAVDLVFSGPVVAGPNPVLVNVPLGTAPGANYMRFRYNLGTALPPIGFAPDGEVEDYLVNIEEEQFEELDWGDAPDGPYPTLNASLGANHVIVPGMYMGTLIDAEPDGQPNATATGDDLSNLPDEDGVFFGGPLTQGSSTGYTIVVSQTGKIDAWIDFNGNGSWLDPGEQILTAAPVNPGPGNVFSVAVPPGAMPGPTFARFRYSTVGGLPPTGPAPDGEVEDYQLDIEEAPPTDWGDAPDDGLVGTGPGDYQTVLATGGARHVINPAMYLGASVDAEPDGQPDPAAQGDDNAGIDDEDGVLWYPMVSGALTAIDVTVSMAGVVDVWIDFNGNGSWLDGGEKVLTAAPVGAGKTQLTFTVPSGVPAVTTAARVRYSSAGVSAPTGPAPDGEVEDYMVGVLDEGTAVFDFGDAPDPSYPTLAASAGAAHALTGPVLGVLVDAEPDGQPDPAALGDDFDLLYPALGDDEDGVTFGYALIGGQPTVVEIIASAPGAVDMWIDWNNNGTWFDPGEQVLMAQPVNPGPNYVTIPVPLVTFTGPTKARVRISGMGGLPPTGFAPDGEVEDHDVFLHEEGGMDFGDAPDGTVTPPGGFPTTMMDFGAAHFIDSLFMGVFVDAEIDGQPHPNALGDDVAGVPDDEDGVSFDTDWIEGANAKLTVTLPPGAPAADLEAWVDWDGDGTWTQAGNHAVVNVPMVPGPNPVTLSVPTGSGLTKTFVRFRLFHAGTSVGFGGFVHGGEVEDYEVPVGKTIRAGISIDRTPNPDQVVLTWTAEPGASSYSVYSSTTLAGGFPGGWTLETSGLTALTWSENLVASRKFYLVVAFP